MFSPTHNPRPAYRFRAFARRAVDSVVSFALLEDISSPPDPVDTDVPDPHHRRVEPPARERRAGGVPARPQDCLTPLAARSRQSQQHELVR